MGGGNKRYSRGLFIGMDFYSEAAEAIAKSIADSDHGAYKPLFILSKARYMQFSCWNSSQCIHTLPMRLIAIIVTTCDHDNKCMT